MGKNVAVPRPLLKTLVALLECWDVSLFDRSIRDEYWGALWALKIRLLKLDIRDAYAMIAKAPDGDARHVAHTEYLRLKSHFDSVVRDSDFAHLAAD